jgi:hypothetical protein
MLLLGQFHIARKMIIITMRARIAETLKIYPLGVTSWIHELVIFVFPGYRNMILKYPVIVAGGF